MLLKGATCPVQDSTAVGDYNNIFYDSWYNWMMTPTT
jgi:hypothetical protein